MNAETILKLLDRVGSNGYAAEVNEDGTAHVEVTANQASKLGELLGSENVSLVSLQGSHVIVSVEIAALQQAAAENKRTRASRKVEWDYTRISSYIIRHDDSAANDVTRAEWNPDTNSGFIAVNGVEIRCWGERYADFYSDVPEEEMSDPDRTVYVIRFETEEGTEQLHRTGFTDLLNQVISFDGQILG